MRDAVLVEAIAASDPGGIAEAYDRYALALALGESSGRAGRADDGATRIASAGPPTVLAGPR